MGLMFKTVAFNGPLNCLNIYHSHMGNLILSVMTGRAIYQHVNNTLNGSFPAKSVAEGMERGVSITKKKFLSDSTNET